MTGVPSADDAQATATVSRVGGGAGDPVGGSGNSLFGVVIAIVFFMVLGAGMMAKG